MRRLLYGVISIWVIDCLNVYAINFSDIDVSFNLSWYIKFIFLVFIMIIGYYGINQGAVFAVIHRDNVTIPRPVKEEKVKLVSDAIAQKQSDALVEYMQKEKAYLNSELRILDIAIDFNQPVHILSHVINTQLNQNFYDFVNRFRIEEAKVRLLDSKYKDLTITAIAFDCGFNSKSTFNRLFKKYTDITPTQYKKTRFLQ